MDDKAQLDVLLRQALENVNIYIDSLSKTHLELAGILVDKVNSIDPKFPKDENSHICKAMTYLYLDRFNDALKSAECALSINPHVAEAYSCKAKAYRGLQKFKSALINHNRAMNLDDCANYHYERGITLMDAVEYDRAMQDFKRADELNAISPDMKWSLTSAWLKGYCLNYMKKYEEANAIADEILPVSKNEDFAFVDDESVTAKILNNKGFSLIALGKYDLAIDCLNYAIKIQDLSSLHSLLGDAYRLSEDTGKAKQEYDKALMIFNTEGNDKYLPAIRAERGLLKLGFKPNTAYEHEALEKKIYSKEKIKQFLHF